MSRRAGPGLPALVRKGNAILMSNSKGSFDQGRNRRRRKFVRRDLQLKIILGTLFVSLAILVFNFSVILLGLWAFTRNLAVEAGNMWPMLNFIMLSFFISVIVSIPMAIWMGVSFSFTFCGPIYALKKYFVELKNGPWTSRCRLRVGDDLQDVKDVINESLDAFRERLAAQKELLDEAEALLGSVTVETSASERVAATLQRMKAENAEFERRFPIPESVAADLEKSLETVPSVDPVPSDDAASSEDPAPENQSDVESEEAQSVETPAAG